MECGDRKTLLIQATRQIIGCTLGSRKNNCLIHLGIAQQMVKQAIFVAHVVGKMQALFDVLVTRLLAVDGDTHRVFQHRRRETNNVLLKRRGEQQRLASRRAFRHNCFQVILEAHVKHAVGFVEHQQLQPRQIDAA